MKLQKLKTGSHIGLSKMKLSNILSTVCVLLMGFSVALIAYNKYRKQEIQEKKVVIETNALKVKKFLLTFKKPVRIEVQNYVKDEKTRFKNDIQEIKKLKIFLDANSDFFVELQMFTDEGDPKAPLVVQCRFLDIKTKNLLQEQSLNLF